MCLFCVTSEALRLREVTGPLGVQLLRAISMNCLVRRNGELVDERDTAWLNKICF